MYLREYSSISVQGEAGVGFPAASAGFGSVSSETESVFEQKQTSSAENGYCISSKSIVLYSSVLIYSSLIEYLRQHQFLAGTWPVSGQLIPKRAKHRILNANAGQDHRPTFWEWGGPLFWGRQGRSKDTLCREPSRMKPANAAGMTLCCCCFFWCRTEK